MSTETLIALVALVVGLLGPLLGFYASGRVVDARLTRAEKDIEEANKRIEEEKARADKDRDRLWDVVEKNRAAHHNDIESVKAMFGEVIERIAAMEGMLRAGNRS